MLYPLQFILLTYLLMNSQYLDGGKYDKDVRRNKSNNEYVHDIWYIIRIFKSRCATKIIIPLKSYYTQLDFLSIYWLKLAYYVTWLLP